MNWIFKVPIDIVEGLKREKAIDLAKKLKFSGKLIDEVKKNFQFFLFWKNFFKFFFLFQVADQILRLYEMFLKVDATQIEINPFGETPDKRGILKNICTKVFILKQNFEFFVRSREGPRREEPG